MPPDGRSALFLMAIIPPWDQRLAQTAARHLSATADHHAQPCDRRLGGLAVRVGWSGGSCRRAVLHVSFWLDHADGELARMTGRTSTFGYYYDLAAGGAVLGALFIGIGIGASGGALGAWALGLGVGAGLATAVIFVLRTTLEQRAGRAAARQPNLLGFELEDVMYLVGPVTWLGLLDSFLVLAGIGTPLFALLVLRQCRRLLAWRPA